MSSGITVPLGGDKATILTYIDNHTHPVSLFSHSEKLEGDFITHARANPESLAKGFLKSNLLLADQQGKTRKLEEQIAAKEMASSHFSKWTRTNMLGVLGLTSLGLLFCLTIYIGGKTIDKHHPSLSGSSSN
jgi:hypothetical protein